MKGSVDYILFMRDDLKEENVQLTSKPLREHSKLLQAAAAAAAAPLWETLDVLKGDSILFLLNQSLLSSLRRHNEPHALLIYFTRRFLNKKERRRERDVYMSRGARRDKHLPDEGNPTPKQISVLLLLRGVPKLYPYASLSTEQHLEILLHI